MEVLMRASLAVAALGIVVAVQGATFRVVSGQAGDVLVFEGARLISGDGSAAIEDAAMVVRDGRIAQVGRRDALQVPAGARRVDLSGKTIMPMLMNVHGHIGYMKGTSVDPGNYSRENILDNLRRLEYYGVGAFQSLGTDRGDLELRIRDEQRAGTLTAGALLLTANDGIVAPNPGALNGGPAFAADVVREAATPADARRHVRELVAKKVDAVKIWVDDRNGTKPKLPPAIYEAAVAEAHALGARIIAHVFMLVDAKGLARAGVHGFAHPVRDQVIDREFVELMKAKDIFQCSTMGIQDRALGRVTADDPTLTETLSPDDRQALQAATKQAPPRNLDAARKTIENVRQGTKMLSDAGVRITLCGDTGITGQFFGYAEHRELESLAAAGLTPLQVIRAGTQTPAAILGLKDMGTLAPGKRADFIVLNANPLEQISNTRQIAAVYKAGRAIDRDALRAGWTRRTSQ
jgi:imidazolonepropionase-like amidohydrolase